MKVYCSTGGFKGITFYEAGNLFLKAGINAIEFSAGKPTKQTLSKLAELNSSSDLMIHNYFPPPHTPFVLNLASKDDLIVKKSLEFFQNAIKISSALSAKYYGIHSGFLSDVSVKEIGGVIDASVTISRDEGMEIFVANVNALAKFANEYEVKLLVENNVLSYKNFIHNRKNTLLLADPGDIKNFFHEVNKDVKLLLDVGHLKVSSNTLGFDLNQAISDTEQWVNGYHLSENLGESDDHMNFGSDAWFFPYLNKSVDFATLEINNASPEEVAKTWQLTNAIVNASI